MSKLTLPKSYGTKWYDNYATFLIKKEKKKEKIDIKKEKIDIKKVKLNKPKKQAYIDENLVLMKERIQILRKNSTIAEKLLNTELVKTFGKFSFIFQKGFFFKKHNFFYITDFYFLKQNIVIEIDGEYHKNIEQKEKDLQREETLKRGFHVKILRFTNEQIYTDITNVMKVITNKINSWENKKFQCKICKAICKNNIRLEKHYKNSHESIN